MEEDKKSKIKRYSVWAVFLIVVGGIASCTLPEHSVPHFFGLLKDIIVSLIVGV